MSAPYKLITPTHPDAHQVVPGAVVTFLPFTYKDTFFQFAKKGFSSAAASTKALEINNPIVVVSDIFSINITNSKANPLDTAEILLASGSVNYSAAIGAGDHALIWLFNNAADYQEMSTKIAARTSNLNGPNSGLKFVGKVNSVREVLNTDPTTGTKTLRYLVSLSGFTELQTQIYYNDLLSPETVSEQTGDPYSFFARISSQYQSLFTSLDNQLRLKTDKLITFFLDVFVGTGPIDNAKKVDDTLTQTPNSSFLVPNELAKYLGVLPGQKSKQSIGFQYSDLLYRIFGVQQYSANANDLNSMYPSNAKKSGRKNAVTCGSLKGGIALPAAKFNNTTLWSLLQQFMNPTLNEMFTSLKYIPNQGILPTITLRQIPFSTDNLANNLKSLTTLYKNLPRWKIDLSWPIMNYNIGTSNAERFNFFQTYTNTISGNNQDDAMKLQITLGNNRIDIGDIIRNGPRVHATYSDTEAALDNNKELNPIAINTWRDLIADWFANGHLKMNGSITLSGIQDPISVGDNLEMDSKLFHIEGINHAYQVNDISKGLKTFTTTLLLSQGYYLNNQGSLQYITDQPHQRHAKVDTLLPGYTDEERIANNQPYVSTNHQPSAPATNPGQNQLDFSASSIESALDRIRSKYGGNSGGII